MTTLYQQFNAALQRRLEAILLLQVSLLQIEVKTQYPKSPRGGKTYVKTNPNQEYTKHRQQAKALH